MFGLFKKKTMVEQLIAKDGFEKVVTVFSMAVGAKLPTREIAYQFILEELDGASQGNDTSKAFARKSGIPAAEYRGALDNSIPEVDGPDGPQQFVLMLSLQLRANPKLMADFRCGIADAVMRRFELGKYA